VVVVLDPLTMEPGGTPSWQTVCEGGLAVAKHVLHHAGWLTACVRHAAKTARPLRIVQGTIATTPAARAAAQAIGQMARSANALTDPPGIDACSISVESQAVGDLAALGHLVARLVQADDGRMLSGAEMVVRPGWLGVRKHPEPLGTVSFAGPAIPASAVDALRAIVT
jgi:hypothetical protein